jgi:hypothetical protein
MTSHDLSKRRAPSCTDSVAALLVDTLPRGTVGSVFTAFFVEGDLTGEEAEALSIIGVKISRAKSLIKLISSNKNCQFRNLLPLLFH